MGESRFPQTYINMAVVDGSPRSPPEISYAGQNNPDELLNQQLECDSLYENMSELQSALPSSLAADFDENYLKNSSKQTFLNAVQRASAFYRNDLLHYKNLAISSPSLDSPHDSSLAASRDSLVAFRQSTIAKNVFTCADLRTSAYHRKRVHRVVEELIEAPKPSKVKIFIPWNGFLEQIHSYFGRATASYFSLIRSLLILNIFSTFIVFFLLVLPYLFASDAPNVTVESFGGCEQRMQQLSSVMCNESYIDRFIGCSREFRRVIDESIKNATWISHTTNIMRGQGHLTLSPLYYAYYTDILWQGERVFPGGLLYFSVVGLVFFGTLIALLVLSFKSVIDNGPTIHRAEDFHHHFSSVVFNGWDYQTTSKFSFDMRTATSRRFLKMELERIMRRKFLEKLVGWDLVRLWVVRILTMLLSFAIIIGGVIVILLSSSCAAIHLENSGDTAESWFASFAADFLPAVVVVILNTFQPDIFVALAKLENYAPENEVKLILLRIIISRFCTVVTFMVPLLGFQLREICPTKPIPKVNSSVMVGEIVNSLAGDATPPSEFMCAVIKLEQSMGPKSYCWEANIGEQLYKIVIIDLVNTIVLTFLYSYLRRILVEKVALMHAKLAWLKKLGRREFELPVEVINLFYIQTITWMGLYFMPLLPLFASVTRLALFYMKRWDLNENTFLTWRVRSADYVQSFYMAYLCSCYIVALAFTGYAVSVLPASPGCGPFAMASLNPALQSVFDELGAMSAQASHVADHLGHPLVAGSFVTVVCFVAICCRLYAMSTKRRVDAIRQLIAAERHIRDYYFSQIATTRLNSDPTNSRIISQMQQMDNHAANSQSLPAARNRRYVQSPATSLNVAAGRRLNYQLPSTYGPDVALGSGVYDLRRQMSRF